MEAEENQKGQPNKLQAALALRDQLRQGVEEMRSISVKLHSVLDSQVELGKVAADLQRERNYWRSKHGALPMNSRSSHNSDAVPTDLISNHDATRKFWYEIYMDSNGLVKVSYVQNYRSAIDNLLRIRVRPTATEEPIPKKMAAKLLGSAIQRVLGAVNNIQSSSNKDGPHAQYVLSIESSSQNLDDAGKRFAVVLVSSTERTEKILIDSWKLLCEAADKLTSVVMHLLRAVKINKTDDFGDYVVGINEPDAPRIKFHGLGGADHPSAPQLHATVPQFLRSGSLSQDSD